jgi:hypothetical protein
MKNVIKGLIFASFALSFGACNNDKPATSTAAAAPVKADTTVATSMAAPATAAAVAAPAAAAATPATASSASTAAAQPVKPAATQTTPPPPPPAATGKTTMIKFEESTYNWGTINEGDKMKHNFVFKNTGTNDLIISDAHGSCGCTVPEWPKEPIKPGKTGEIKVVFDSKGKPGDQQKQVTLTANTEPTNTVLNIKGTVKPAAEEKK